MATVPVVSSLSHSVQDFHLPLLSASPNVDRRGPVASRLLEGGGGHGSAAVYSLGCDKVEKQHLCISEPPATKEQADTSCGFYADAGSEVLCQMVRWTKIAAKQKLQQIRHIWSLCLVWVHHRNYLNIYSPRILLPPSPPHPRPIKGVFDAHKKKITLSPPNFTYLA